jgi:hypothetical protein
MYLLILCAVTAGCGTSGEPKGAAENLAAGGPPTARAGTRPAERKAEMKDLAAKRNAADEEKADEGEAADRGYFKIRVEVELRGVLTCAEKEATIATDRRQEWVLEFGGDKEMRTKAKGLDGKTVLVKGSAIIRYDPERAELARKLGAKTRSAWNPEPTVAVKSLVAATKE